MLNSDTITTAQIRTLRSEAIDAGDSRMAEWCDVALAPRENSDAEGRKLVNPTTGGRVTRSEARVVCARAINDAAANT